MRTIKNLSQILILFSFVFIAISCSDDDDTVAEQKTIAELASETDDLSSLVAALDRADLVTTVDGEGSFTVFAPTNAAFSAFLSANGFNSVDEVPVDVLSNILLNHVISGEFQSGSLTTGYITTNAKEASTGNNISMYINTDNGVRINGASSVVTADIEASNGVIHIVDEVIGLPTLVSFATADASFSTLVAALTRADLTTDFVSVLSGDGPFTVFAPTNTAFADLLAELGVSGLADIDVNTLDAVLKYHVVSGANVLSTMLSDDMGVQTLASSEFTIDLDNGAEIIDNNGRRTEIIVTDVQASNGVVHVIDGVLLP